MEAGLVSWTFLLHAFACLIRPAEFSISLGTCSLTCNEEDSLPESNPMGRGLPGPVGKAGPQGQKGSPGQAGADGPAGSPGRSCDCSKYEEALMKLNSVVENRFRDCVDVKRVITTSGISVIYPFRQVNTGIHAYCDQVTDGGGWIVIQRRVGETQNFHRDWTDYVTGFGRKETDFWMGLEIIHKLTSNGSWELRVDLEDFDKSKAFAKYSSFVVSGASDEYRLSVSGYSGDAGDSLVYHNGMKFATKDRDNDEHGSTNCAMDHMGAWWYNACHTSNLNGKYNGSENRATGVSWHRWHNNHKSLKRVDMKIRPRG